MSGKLSEGKSGHWRTRDGQRRTEMAVGCWTPWLWALLPLLPLLLLLGLPSLAASAAAPDDVIYFVSYELANQSVAREICRRHGYEELARLDSPEKQRLAELAIQSYNRSRAVGDLWLGAASQAMDGNYSWYGKGLISWAHWDNINDDEPDEFDSQGCVRIKVSVDFLWATKQCSRAYGALCEKSSSSQRSATLEVMARDAGVAGQADWTETSLSRSRCFSRCVERSYHCLLVFYSASSSTCTLYSTYQVAVTPGALPGSVLAVPLPDRT